MLNGGHGGTACLFRDHRISASPTRSPVWVSTMTGAAPRPTAVRCPETPENENGKNVNDAKKLGVTASILPSCDSTPAVLFTAQAKRSLGTESCIALHFCHVPQPALRKNKRNQRSRSGLLHQHQLLSCSWGVVFTTCHHGYLLLHWPKVWDKNNKLPRYLNTKAGCYSSFLFR